MRYSRFGAGQARSRDVVPAPDGSTDFGLIDDEVAAAIGGEAAPIRLQEGRHDARTGEGFGRVHIEGQRGDAIRKAGYADASAFVAEVASNYQQVYDTHSGRRMIVKRNGRAKLAVVELDRSGDHWTVVSAGIFRPSYLHRKKLLWEGERRSPFAASDADSPLRRGGQSVRDTIAKYTADRRAAFRQAVFDRFHAVHALGRKSGDTTPWEALQLTKNLTSMMAVVLRHGPLEVYPPEVLSGR